MWCRSGIGYPHCLPSVFSLPGPLPKPGVQMASGQGDIPGNGVYQKSSGIYGDESDPNPNPNLFSDNIKDFDVD